ncbi:hypothetical protein [Acidovorax sp. NCPPB 4044]|uniref:hypothetical protein n=1 Tax=Acidovorax sp. NCPPB 4044 TaxID=2940490 RepID=UPI002302DEF2|nr:hypothetical protein [Acidovorax sp. NCPPB 4044]MDA8521577.1 hypothetical protein [Acidovorax sp. NCPPB 4044]
MPGSRGATSAEPSVRRARSAPPRPGAGHSAQAPALPLAAVVGEPRARRLDADWGTLQGARMKRGRPQIHAWEAGTHPERVAIPPGNPGNLRLDALLDLEAVRQGTPVLWSIGPAGTLLLGPHTELDGLDPDTGKSRRRGHPSLLEGTLKDAAAGQWWGKEARISGELGWDAAKERFYIVNQSGRYSRHADRGRVQMENVERRFGQAGLPVEIRLVERG